MQAIKTATETLDLTEKHRSLAADTFHRFLRNKMAVVGAITIILLIFVAIFAPLLTSYDPRKTHIRESMEGPSAKHIMGTDETGRDIYSRTLHGARISLSVGFVGILIALIIGLTLGALSGYYGGWIDSLIMRFTDIVLAFPAALLAIAVAAVFERRSIFTLFLILGLIRWASIARIVRAKVISLKESEFSEAARALGGSDFRIIFRHILPNSFAPIMVAATIGIAGNILTEAWLSFLGLGLDASVPSWGTMIRDALGQTERYWLYVFPGFAIMIAVLGFNLLGDGLRDVLDPRLKGTS